ncbi:hypothetical protein DFP93_101374 [Aneurinibacillus soli]|uniref:Uncharacterized protein n=1 Tax=Aneurinibacillus soli TaxID=1500254 RepID=A0A0U4WI30_9BACL|nr:hypothetical protein [Aneurinibacillus soli]PYE64347.1 hypothetical protein DFP93_101374 [Aneurinibacillus soli]BAU28296.1 hypothetical protein CB4_02470 [Aneurinibacillus soli]
MIAQTSSSPAQKTAPTLRIQEKLQGIFIGLLACGYILLQFFHQHWLEIGLSIIIGLIIVTILPTLRGSTMVVSVVLLVGGIILLSANRAPVQEWLAGFRINLTLVALFIFSPLLGIPIKIGGYVQALKSVFKEKMNQPYFFFLGSSILTHILGTVLNIGSTAIVYHLSTASKIRVPRLLADGISRGFGSAIFWSPYFAAMALVLSQLPITWSSIVLPAIGLALISFVVSLLIDLPIIRQVTAEDNQDDEEEIVHQTARTSGIKKVVELFSILLAIMAIVLVIERLSNFGMVVIICLVSLVFSFVWCMLAGKTGEYVRELRDHTFLSIPRMKKEVVLFLVAGFFSSALSHVNLGTFFVEQLNQVFGSFIIGKACFLSILVVLSAMIGLHPIIMISIFVTTIQPELIGVSNAFFAVLLLGSFGIANVISPASGANNLLSNVLRADILDVSIRWNRNYVFAMAIILPIYLQLIRL